MVEDQRFQWDSCPLPEKFPQDGKILVSYSDNYLDPEDFPIAELTVVAGEVIEVNRVCDGVYRMEALDQLRTVEELQALFRGKPGDYSTGGEGYDIMFCGWEEFQAHKSQRFGASQPASHGLSIDP